MEERLKKRETLKWGIIFLSSLHVGFKCSQRLTSVRSGTEPHSRRQHILDFLRRCWSIRASYVWNLYLCFSLLQYLTWLLIIYFRRASQHIICTNILNAYETSPLSCPAHCAGNISTQTLHTTYISATNQLSPSSPIANQCTSHVCKWTPTPSWRYTPHEYEQ